KLTGAELRGMLALPDRGRIPGCLSGTPSRRLRPYPGARPTAPEGRVNVVPPGLVHEQAEEGGDHDEGCADGEAGAVRLYRIAADSVGQAPGPVRVEHGAQGALGERRTQEPPKVHHGHRDAVEVRRVD